MEKKEHLLAETDEMWVSLRHKHFAEATQEITRMLDDFRQKNKAAAYKGGNDGGGLDMRNMRNLVSSLPQYRSALGPGCFPDVAAADSLHRSWAKS